jgi:ubiquinone/menaquinone biosynthesis C-methylase UbiE
MTTLMQTTQAGESTINPNQALWEQGDFTRIAQAMRESGKQLAESLGVGPRQRVLDLGCGDGTTAVPLAREGASVLGVDIAHNLVAAGNARAAELGLHRLVFQQGDACNLRDLASGAFDLTISIFGAMFAPKPWDVARELVRVTRAGGRIVMGNWIPDDPTSFVSQLLKISAAYTPAPPAGFVSRCCGASKSTSWSASRTRASPRNESRPSPIPTGSGPANRPKRSSTPSATSTAPP